MAGVHDLLRCATLILIYLITLNYISSFTKTRQGNSDLELNITIMNTIYQRDVHRNGQISAAIIDRGQFSTKQFRRKFFKRRMVYYNNTHASYNHDCWILLSGGCLNPGQRQNKDGVNNTKCFLCQRAIGKPKRPLQCSECSRRVHWKCAGLNPRVRSQNENRWQCWDCNLPFNFSDSFFEEAPNNGEHNYANQPLNQNLSTTENEVLETLRTKAKDAFLCHLNINSIQNKFEELVDTIKKLNAHIIFISETKIDSTYPDSQFNIPGYSLYRNDRKKGGGGVLALISTSLPCKRLRPGRTYKCFELIVINVTIRKTEWVIIGMYGRT